MSEAAITPPRFLLDVNVFFSLLSVSHVHHELVTEWFDSSATRWAICAFTEAGFIRNATAPRPGSISMSEANAVLSRAAQHPGYHYVPITSSWKTLCAPFFKRLYGTKQVTDAFLLGLAVENGLVLVTLDKGIVHLAGEEHRSSVLLLSEKH